MPVMLYAFIGSIAAVFIALVLVGLGVAAGVWFHRRDREAAEHVIDYGGQAGFYSGIFEGPMGDEYGLNVPRTVYGPDITYSHYDGSPHRIRHALVNFLLVAIVATGLGAIGLYVNLIAMAAVAGAGVVGTVGMWLLRVWARWRLERETQRANDEWERRYAPSRLRMETVDPDDYVEVGVETAPESPPVVTPPTQ